MILWLIGGVIAFKWLYSSGVGSGKPAPKKQIGQRKPPPRASRPAAGEGEDFTPKSELVTPPEKPADSKASEPAKSEKEPAKTESTLALPTRKGGKGSFDDVLDDDPTGVGIDEVEELNGPDYNKGAEDEEEEA